MWFQDPGHVSDVLIRPNAEEALKNMPQSRRTTWERDIENAKKDILGTGTVLGSEKHTGTYDPKYQSWDMPPELGIGISAVDDGVATVTLIQHRLAGFDTLCQVVTYLNGNRIFHKVTVGEILPPGSGALGPVATPQSTAASHTPTSYDPDDYARQLREADVAYRTLMAQYQTRDARTREALSSELANLVALLKDQGRVLDEKSPTDEPRAAPDWFSLTATEFEQAIAELCRKDGCTRVQTPGGAGDLGADVIAYTPDDRKLVIQCKQYNGKVRSPDVQKFAGTVFHIHRADVALLVTTASLTAPAADCARAAGIRVAEARQLNMWATGTGQPPWK
ncbi:restriction endonuclease [Streptomyces sp. NPDC050658]|uniref:restriction endonuclease n=1 Tax=unclassified Streptomyces TaxID=2593676 RepID=UPI00344AF284